MYRIFKPTCKYKYYTLLVFKFFQQLLNITTNYVFNLLVFVFKKNIAHFLLEFKINYNLV